MLGFAPLASAPIADSGESTNQFSLVADAGTFTLTGQDVNSLLGHALTADSGSFSTTGQDANFNITLPVDVTSNPSGATSVQYDVSVATGTNEYGTGNKYYIDGLVGASPTLQLMAGVTYRFDQSASSNSSHPLRFSTTPNGSHGGGSEYTTGVTTNGTAGSSGAYTEITPTATTPRLFYYCTNHSGMGGQASANGGIHTITSQDAELKRHFFMDAEIGLEAAIIHNFRSYLTRRSDNGYFYLGENTTLGGYSNVIVPEQPIVQFSISMLAETGTFSLTGQDVSFNVTALFERGTFSLTGLPHNKAISELARHVTMAFTGQDASFTITRQSDVGSFSTTGQDVSFALNMPVDQATFSSSGQDASLIKDLNLTADKADFVLTGQASVFGVTISPAHGSIVLTGQDAVLNKALNVAANVGSFTLTGQDALKGISEIGAAVSYAVTGFDVQFTIKLAAENGSFTLAGQDALKGISELAAAVSYTLTGQDVTFAVQVTMIVDSASFTLTGQDANIKFVFNRSEFDGYEQRTVFRGNSTIEVTTESINSVDIEAVDQNELELYSLTENSVTIAEHLNEAA